MRSTADIMGMPVTIEVFGDTAEDSIKKAFDYFRAIDERFSTYKAQSEVSRINRGEIGASDWSDEMREIAALAEETKRDTQGYFDMRRPDGNIDPSGIVKGHAIREASKLLRALGHEDFYVEAGGDIQTGGLNARREAWRIGIRNPLKRTEIIKVVVPRGAGVATSGTAVRGAHIYDPHTGAAPDPALVSLTVIGPDVYEADRFATAAFAMGRAGIGFIESLAGFEGYLIDRDGVATVTSGFSTYL